MIADICFPIGSSIISCPSIGGWHARRRLCTPAPPAAQNKTPLMSSCLKKTQEERLMKMVNTYRDYKADYTVYFIISLSCWVSFNKLLFIMIYPTLTLTIIKMRWYVRLLSVCVSACLWFNKKKMNQFLWNLARRWSIYQGVPQVCLNFDTFLHFNMAIHLVTSLQVRTINFVFNTNGNF